MILAIVRNTNLIIVYFCLTIMIKELRALHQLTCEKLYLEARAILQHNGCSVVQEFLAKLLLERRFMA